MSFFDEGDEPRTAVRPRRAAPVGPAPDQQTLLVRRGVAVGAGVLLLILIVVGIKGCLNSQKKRSLRDYNRSVTTLIQESDTGGREFFRRLNGGGGDAAGLENGVNQDRVTAEELVKRAKRLDVPDDMKPAQRYLIDVLELRRDALRKIASKLTLALARGNADQAGTATAQITGQMQAFLTSDVLYSQRVIPYVKRALDDADITGQTIATSRFLPNLGWLDETQVAGRIGSTARRRTGGPVAPGLHGHGLTSVSVGGVTLDSAGPNRVPAGSNLTFSVKLQNQGENDETSVGVRLSITGAGKPINVTRTVAQTTKGQESSIDIPLGQAPPIGRPVRASVEVQPVPGEKKTDNNRQSYGVVFTP